MVVAAAVTVVVANNVVIFILIDVSPFLLVESLSLVASLIDIVAPCTIVIAMFLLTIIHHGSSMCQNDPMTWDFVCDKTLSPVFPTKSTFGTMTHDKRL